MVDLKHQCIIGTARAKVTILKRMRALKHPSSQVSLVGVHRIHMDRSSIADEVSGSLNPGCNQDQPEEPLSSEFPGLDLDRDLGDEFDADFGCELHESEDLEAARAFGLLD